MKQTILSNQQSALLEDLIVKYGQIVTSDQIYAQGKNVWGKQVVKNVVTRLTRNGWLIRVKRGLYAISDLSNRGFLSLSPYVVANLLVKDSFVSFESALAYHGMFDQLTNKTISISRVQYKAVKLESVEYSFVKVLDKWFFGWQEVRIDNRTVRMATAEKALIDMIQFNKSKYMVDLVVEKLSLYKDSLDLQKMIEYLGKMSLTTIKIFGFLFDLLGINSGDFYNQVKLKGTHLMLSHDTKFNAKWRLYYDEYFDKYQLTK
ncbi:MAG: type IV toxin-antitoxin system AbiEi family antitoxin domain-containing protein [Candidatus Beckwithbacteria bacterium]|nr:type IV toxin-antitoxin system AbiEi family antitoxin domain-containing protein [Patescibacteria group bacterium]